MRVLYYDCFSGISGDMHLGAMLDLGVPKEYLIGELSKLKVEGYKIEVTEDNRKGITGTKVKVVLSQEEIEEPAAKDGDKCYEEHTHMHHHHVVYEHEHHHEGQEGHHHDHNEEYQEHAIHSHGEAGHQHRNLRDIERIINSSDLSEKVKKLSLDIFLKVAQAEAKVHGKSLKDVHFHEVGALDSIVDIIGGAICIDYLKVDKIMCSSVELGGGFVKCAHGLFPVPAPATAEILKNVPVKLGAVSVETTTPTGAAILAAVVSEFTDNKQFMINKIGYGIGHRDTVIPNVLRIYLGETQEKTRSNDFDFEDAVMIECNIDDMNPEAYDFIMAKLFNLGAMDAFLTSIIMKKGRPATKLSVLCGEDIEDVIIEFILKETTTLGVRKYRVDKTMLKRESSTINTAYGEVRIKTSFYNGEKIKVKPEYDDCKRIALEKNITLNKVYEEVMRILALEDKN